LLSVSSSGQICHWHLSRGSLLHSFVEKARAPGDGSVSQPNEIYTCAYDSDCSLFLTAGKDNAVRIYDEGTNTLIYTLVDGNKDTTGGHSNRIFSARFCQDNSNIVASGGWDQSVQIWDLRAGYSVFSFHDVNVCGDSIDVYGHTMVVGSWKAERQIQIYDLRDLRCIAGGEENPIDWFGLGANGEPLPPACTQEEYDAAKLAYTREREDEAKKRERLISIARRVEAATAGALSESDDQRALQAALQAASKIQIETDIAGDDITMPWKEKLVSESVPEPTQVYSARLVKVPGQTRVVACGSGGNEAKVFDWSTGKVLAGMKLPRSGFASAVSPDGRFVAYGGAGYGIVVANMPE